jgi:hypothetical protein
MHRFFTGSVFVWVCFVFGFAWMFIHGVWTSPCICIMYDATSFLSGSSPDDLHFLSFRLIDLSVSSQSVSQTRREFKMGPRKSCNQSLPFCSRPSLSLTAVIPLSDLLHGSTVPAYVKHRLCSTSPHRYLMSVLGDGSSLPPSSSCWGTFKDRNRPPVQLSIQQACSTH